MFLASGGFAAQEILDNIWRAFLIVKLGGKDRRELVTVI